MDDNIRIEIARNAATNGRWFNGLVFAWLTMAGDERSMWVALFPILSIGLAYLGDMAAGRFRVLLLGSVVSAIIPLVYIASKGF